MTRQRLAWFNSGYMTCVSLCLHIPELRFDDESCFTRVVSGWCFSLCLHTLEQTRHHCHCVKTVAPDTPACAADPVLVLHPHIVCSSRGWERSRSVATLGVGLRELVKPPTLSLSGAPPRDPSPHPHTSSHQCCPGPVRLSHRYRHIEARLAGRYKGAVPPDWFARRNFGVCEVCSRVFAARNNNHCVARAPSALAAGRALVLGAPTVMECFGCGDKAEDIPRAHASSSRWQESSRIAVDARGCAGTDLLTLSALVLARPAAAIAGGRGGVPDAGFFVFHCLWCGHYGPLIAERIFVVYRNWRYFAALTGKFWWSSSATPEAVRCEKQHRPSLCGLLCCFGTVWACVGFLSSSLSRERRSVGHMENKPRRQNRPSGARRAKLKFARTEREDPDGDMTVDGHANARLHTTCWLPVSNIY